MAIKAARVVLRTKWVCRICGGVHWYRNHPLRCQRCGAQDSCKLYLVDERGRDIDPEETVAEQIDRPAEGPVPTWQRELFEL